MTNVLTSLSVPLPSNCNCRVRFFTHILWRFKKYLMNTQLLRLHFCVSSEVFRKSQNSHARLDERVYEECEMVFVSMRLSCGVCEYAFILQHVCMWLPVGWECRVGIFQAPCCSRNICPFCGTNQSAEPVAVTNQAAWWSFHGILGWSWNKGRHLPPLPSYSPSLPTPFRLWYLRPPHGEITSPSLHNPTDHDRKMTDLESPVRWHIWKLVCFTHPRFSAILWYCASGGMQYEHTGRDVLFSIIRIWDGLMEILTFNVWE